MSPAVSLPMYNQAPDLVAAFWIGLRRHLQEAGLDDLPTNLFWPADLDAHWVAPGTRLSQTCGYPLATGLAGRVHYVGTPRYAAPGCLGSDYRSVVVVRAGDPARTLADLRGRRAAINSRYSQSGHNGLRALVAPLAESGRFFFGVIESGAHARSLDLVRQGEADTAAIDCVSFALFGQHQPASIEGLRVVAETDLAPGLPIITSLATTAQDIARMRAGFSAACADPSLLAVRQALLIDGFEVRPLGDYDRSLAMEASAARLGYPVLN